MVEKFNPDDMHKLLISGKEENTRIFGKREIQANTIHVKDNLPGEELLNYTPRHFQFKCRKFTPGEIYSNYYINEFKKEYSRFIDFVNSKTEPEKEVEYLGETRNFDIVHTMQSFGNMPFGSEPIQIAQCYITGISYNVTVTEVNDSLVFDFYLMTAPCFLSGKAHQMLKAQKEAEEQKENETKELEVVTDTEE